MCVCGVRVCVSVCVCVVCVCVCLSVCLSVYLKYILPVYIPLLKIIILACPRLVQLEILIFLIIFNRKRANILNELCKKASF